jgi:hypothetical protein
VRAAGARFPPVPAGDDLEVEGEDVAGFLREAVQPHDRLDSIAQGAGPARVEEHRRYW